MCLREPLRKASQLEKRAIRDSEPFTSESQKGEASQKNERTMEKSEPRLKENQDGKRAKKRREPNQEASQ
jgi:hypothetical protein